jgi:hypothetical protein
MSISHEGRQRKIMNDGSFSQQHVELVQAISLTINPEDFKDGVISPAAVQLLFDLLPEMGNTYSLHRLSSPKDVQTEEEAAIYLGLAEFRWRAFPMRQRRISWPARPSSSDHSFTLRS